MSSSDSRPRVDAAALSTLTMRQCTGLLKPLMKMEDAALFLVPVDAVALKLDDYHTIVTEPMDLGTIEKKLDKSGYSSVEDFIRDVRLVWGNALKYNPPENPVYALADRMDAEFEKKLAELSGVPLTTAPAAGAAPAAAAKGPAVPFKDVKALLKILDNHKLSAPFRTPVDWEKGGLTNYLQVVERPMDLGTIGAKLDGAEPYATTAELLADVDLVWANCIKYNGEGAWISEHAQQLREHTAKKVKQLGWKEGATITPEPAKKPPAEKKAPTFSATKDHKPTGMMRWYSVSGGSTGGLAVLVSSLGRGSRRSGAHAERRPSVALTSGEHSMAGRPSSHVICGKLQTLGWSHFPLTFLFDF